MYYLKREVYKNFIFSGEIMEGPALSAPFPYPDYSISAAKWKWSARF